MDDYALGLRYFKQLQTSCDTSIPNYGEAGEFLRGYAAAERLHRAGIFAPHKEQLGSCHFADHDFSVIEANIHTGRKAFCRKCGDERPV